MPEQHIDRIQRCKQNLTRFVALETVSKMTEILAPTVLQTRTLKFDRAFQPCEPQDGDELFPNGILEFNIRRLREYIEADAARFPAELADVAEVLELSGCNLDEATICAADLSRPILLAEIASGRFNVIDGHHLIAKARREYVVSIPVRRVRVRSMWHFSRLSWPTRSMLSIGIRRLKR